MLILSRLPPPPLSDLSPNPRIASPAPHRFSSSSSNLLPLQCQATERGHEFETGGTFYRRESAVGRDLGVLAASLHKQSSPQLRVLDAMCGCGIRSLRYLLEAGADFVLANDANDDYRSVIARNLSRVRDEGRWVLGIEGQRQTAGSEPPVQAVPSPVWNRRFRTRNRNRPVPYGSGSGSEPPNRSTGRFGDFNGPVSVRFRARTGPWPPLPMSALFTFQHSCKQMFNDNH